MEICEKDLKDLIEIPETDAKNIASSFTNIVLKIAKNGGIQKKKIGKGKTGGNSYWFDSDCKTAKKELKKTREVSKTQTK